MTTYRMTSICFSSRLAFPQYFAVPIRCDRTVEHSAVIAAQSASYDTVNEFAFAD